MMEKAAESVFSYRMDLEEFECHRLQNVHWKHLSKICYCKNRWIRLQ